MVRSIADAIARELSGRRAKLHMAETHRTDRFFSTDRYQETADCCQAQFEVLGLEGWHAWTARRTIT